MDENKDIEIVDESIDNEENTSIVEESFDNEENTPNVNNELMEMIKAQNEEIAELKKMLSEKFTQTEIEPENEVDAFLNSAKSLTSKILKSFGKEEK